MKYIHILVEGQTEFTFVEDVLRKYFEVKDIWVDCSIVTTRVVTGGKNYRGGFIKYDKFKKQVQNLLTSHFEIVTMMLDIYALPNDFPQPTDSQFPDSESRTIAYENALQADINHSKFLPYYSLHEFEALLFSSPEIIARLLSLDVQTIQKILQTYQHNPEQINLEQPPSKHLLKLFAQYEKVIYGAIIATEISIDTMREHCPHFNRWLTSLEARLTD